MHVSSAEHKVARVSTTGSFSACLTSSPSRMVVTGVAPPCLYRGTLGTYFSGRPRRENPFLSYSYTLRFARFVMSLPNPSLLLRVSTVLNSSSSYLPPVLTLPGLSGVVLGSFNGSLHLSLRSVRLARAFLASLLRGRGSRGGRPIVDHVLTVFMATSRQKLRGEERL